MMITRKEIYALALALIAAIVLHAWWVSSRNVIEAQQVQKDMQPVHQQAQQGKETATAKEDANQHTLAQVLAAIAAQKQAPCDRACIEQLIEKKLGDNSPRFTVPSQPLITPDPEPSPDLPDSGSVTINPNQVKKLRDYMLECDATKAKLESCQQTVENTTTKLTAEEDDHAATKRELEAARKAMKGGGFLSRLGGSIKTLLAGGALTAGIVCATGHCK